VEVTHETYLWIRGEGVKLIGLGVHSLSEPNARFLVNNKWATII